MARVLVIDDDPAIRRLVARVLEGAGHDVSSAEEGLSALEQIARQPPDLVVSDIYMPEMDGIELLIRLAETSPGTPVVAMSGGGHMSTSELLENARLLGALEVLEKPFTIDRLLEAVARALDGREAVSEGGEEP